MAKNFLTSEEIINYIATSKKTTPVKVYVKGDLTNIDLPDNVKDFGGDMWLKTTEEIVLYLCLTYQI